MAADLGDLACFDSNNPVAWPDSREAVSDDHHSTPLSNSAEVVLDYLFTLRVERAGGFIKNENSRICDECARDG